MPINWELLTAGLAAGGSDLAQFGKLGPNMAKVVQGNIEQKNFDKMFAKMMSGQMPEDITLKAGQGKVSVTADAKRMSRIISGDLFDEGELAFNASPNQQKQQQLSELSNTQPIAPVPNAPMQSQQQAQQVAGQQISNPFTFQNPGDMVGLTPQHMALALEMKQRIESLPVDLKYKQAMINQMNASPEQEQALLVSPEGLNVTPSIFKILPKREQEYLLYSEGEKFNGRKPVDRPTFMSMEPTERIKTLTALLNDPRLAELDMKLRSSGATNINLGDKKELIDYQSNARTREYINKSEYDIDVQGKENLLNPEALAKSIKTQFETDEYRRQLNQFEVEQEKAPEGQRVSRQQKRTTDELSFVETQILRAGGEIVQEPYIEGNRMVWVVKFPNDSEPRKVYHEISK